MKQKIIALLIAACGITPLQAGEMPDFGDISQQGLSTQQEREIGENAMRQIRRSGAMLEDPEIVAYLNQVGYRLTDAAEISQPQFTFFPLLDASVNAFAMPGGFVGVHTGLLVQAQHESEVASVLAHEIAHVSQRHIARLIDGTKSSPWISLASIAVALLASQAGRGDAAVAAIAAGTGVAVQRQLDFTYSFEQEADRIGMQTLKKSGYDPSAMVVFFERLQKHNRLYENNAPDFLRTHPVTFKRISDAQARLGEIKFKAVPDSLEFLFIREKSRAMQMGGRDGVPYYQGIIQEKRYANETAQHYGLAYSYYLLQQYDLAWQSLQTAKDSLSKAKNHPMLAFLAGNIKLGQGKNAQAVQIMSDAVQAFPANRALLYGLIDAYIASGQFAEAKSSLNDALEFYPSDAWLYQRQAKMYAKQGDLMRQYQSQGEYYVRLQEYTAAFEQFELALKQPGNDFYLLSGIEARLNQLRQEQQDARKKK
ncbi:beta-barrel assembly-enhancing protease [Deefgea piscis]|uniref:beta-barrel assembly-enhancing protease n=1 Tax=Deefgea piscis TaxID=2739061 RepID=UPI001C80213A|nr:M48 family metalloprotease [Deefgea piscis]QZA82214.1 M48 family metalloprotease [Deefgea piscis]